MIASNTTGTVKDRTTNFSKDEATKLAQLLREYPTITSKKTDHASNQQKDAAWLSLAEKFNCDAVIYRNIKQFQQKFNNMKKTARKEMSAEKSGRRQTGGGPPPSKPSETTEWLNTLMGESISGLPAEYDSDVLAPNTIIGEDLNNTGILLENIVDVNEERKPPKPSLDEITQVQFEIQNTNVLKKQTHLIEKEADIVQDCDIIFDSSTPKALLRKPVSKQLVNCYNKRKRACTPFETRKSIVSHFESKKDLITLKKAREEELKKWALDEHTENMNHRRKVHETELTLFCLRGAAVV